MRKSDKNKFVEVAPLTNIGGESSEFLYSLPKGFDPSPGALVQIPFGKRTIEGVVIGKKSNVNPKFKLKPISLVIDKEALSPVQVELAYWMSERYIVKPGIVLKAMLPLQTKFLPKNKKVELIKSKKKRLKLTADQKKAIESVRKSQNTVSLIYGITGSGKTEVYLRLIEEQLKKGKQALMLVPEIALTPQTVNRIEEFFGKDEVAVFHSKMSTGARYRSWLSIRSGKAKIAVGPRSALFAPFRNLGIIVMDEEQDQSFKQWDSTPRYHAREVAEKYTKLLKIKLVLGSATPSIESAYFAHQKKYNLIHLTKRIQAKRQTEVLPKVEIINTKDEYEKGNFCLLSEELQARLKSNFSNKKQAIIFLNRRGFASIVYCKDCGKSIDCPNCDIPLVFHKSSQKMECHHCNHRENFPLTCPSCKSVNLRTGGKGTEQAVTEIKSLIPKAKILRLDKDSFKKVSDFKKLEGFKDHKYDVLIGTQMVALGLDLPQVALVGIINPEQSLAFPDFRSNERTFELITQVAGRAGRKNERGLVILQTRNPEHFTIKTAANHDYATFYAHEIKKRKKLGYPPFKEIALINYRSKTQGQPRRELLKLVGQIPKPLIKKMEILGPAPAFLPKKGGYFNWNLSLKYNPENHAAIAKLLEALPSKFKIDINPLSLL